VPDTREELLKLPGVGCKTADCVLNYAFGKGVIVVDGNVLRVANRLGLSDSADPKKVRGDLTLFVPEKLRSDINYLLVRLGQEICIPRSPKCSACPITQYCEYGQ
jgi:endonuclease-3